MFGKRDQQTLTYKVNLDTQSMQQQMQQMQFQQQSMMAGPVISGTSHAYADQEALRNFAMAQQAQQMATMDYASMTFRERAGLAVVRGMTQGMAIAGGALSVGAAMAEAPILPFAGDLAVMGAEGVTGKTFYPSALIGAATANLIEGTLSGAAESFRYKHTLNIAEGHNLLGSNMTSGFKNNLSIFAGDLAGYYNLNPDQMTGVLTSAIDNELIDPQDLEKTKENVTKLTRSLTASTKVLYESLDMIDKTIQDFKNYAIFNSKPESMLETATFLKSISGLTGHSVDQLLQTTESLSNAFISGTALNAGDMAPVVAQGIAHAYTGMDMLNSRSQQLIRNSGGIDALHGRILAQAQQYGVNNPAIFPHLAGLYQYATGQSDSWEAGMDRAHERVGAEYAKGNAVGASYIREQMAKILANPEEMARLLHAEVGQMYAPLIQSGGISYQEAFSLAAQNILGVDAGTAEAAAPVLMRITSARAGSETSLQQRLMRMAEIDATDYGKEGSSIRDIGRGLGRWVTDFFMGDPNEGSAWFGNYETKPLNFRGMQDRDRKNFLQLYTLDDKSYLELSAADKRKYDENVRLMMSSKISDVQLGTQNMGSFFLDRGLSLDRSEDITGLAGRHRDRVDTAERVRRILDIGTTYGMTGQEVDYMSYLISLWADKYFGRGVESSFDKEEKYKALRKDLQNAGFTEEQINANIQRLRESESAWSSTERTGVSDRSILWDGYGGSPVPDFTAPSREAAKLIKEGTDRISAEQTARVMDMFTTRTYNLDNYLVTQSDKGIGPLAMQEALRKVGVSQDRIETLAKTGNIILSPEEYAKLDRRDRSRLNRETLINPGEIQDGLDAVATLSKFNLGNIERNLSLAIDTESYKEIFDLIMSYRAATDDKEKQSIALEIAQKIEGLNSAEKKALTRATGIDVEHFTHLSQAGEGMAALGTDSITDYLAASSASQETIRRLVETLPKGTKIKVPGMFRSKEVDIRDLINEPQHLDKVIDFLTGRIDPNVIQGIATDVLLEGAEKASPERSPSSSLGESFNGLRDVVDKVTDDFINLGEALPKPK